MSYTPVNIYRLQFNRHFTLYDGIEVLPYLKALGVDALYCSPLLCSVRGSSHGYDLTNPLAFNKEIGGEKGFEAFCAFANRLGLSIILDCVVNHMAASLENPWWYDVLEKGQSSSYADYFDINWQVLQGKVLVPCLDTPLYEALRAGKVYVKEEEGKLTVEACGWSLPCSQEGYKAYSRDLERDPEWLASFLELQHFKLEFWQAAHEACNYRRFFDISSLVALKMEKDGVFNDFHPLIEKLLREKKVQGLRIDHPDGLYDPYGYLVRLQALGADYLIVEKILKREEKLPRHWPIQGSVG
ncbi:MAG: malto-oligosyltrehalose synthase, partial [Chlamydiae bacterium]|nr:malto-oligosyltrehalose synthase [Chlamydiota bacterium]